MLRILSMLPMLCIPEENHGASKHHQFKTIHINLHSPPSQLKNSTTDFMLDLPTVSLESNLYLKNKKLSL